MAEAALTIAFDARINSLEAAIKRVDRSLDSLDKNTKETAQGFTAVAASSKASAAAMTSTAVAARGLALAFSTVARAFLPLLAFDTVIRIFSGVVSKIDEINNGSAKLALSSQNYQTVARAFKEIGESSDTAVDAISQFNSNLAKAATGDKSSAKAFERMNIAIKDANGVFRDNDAVMADVIKSIHNAASETDQLAIATKFFGEQGRNMVAVTKEMEGSLEAYQKQLAAKGYIISNESIDQIKKLKKAYSDLFDSAGVYFTELTAKLAPFLTFMSKVFTIVYQLGTKLVNGIGWVITTVSSKLQEGLAHDWDFFIKMLQDGLRQVAEIFRTLGSHLNTFTNYLGSIDNSVFKTIFGENLYDVFAAATNGVNSFGVALGQSADYLDKLNSSNIGATFDSWTTSTEAVATNVGDMTVSAEGLNSALKETKKIDPFKGLYEATKKAREEITKVTQSYIDEMWKLSRESRTPIEKFKDNVKEISTTLERVLKADPAVFKQLGGMETFQKSVIKSMEETSSALNESGKGWLEYSKAVQEVVETMRSAGFDAAAANIENELIKQDIAFRDATDSMKNTADSLDDVKGTMTSWASGMENTFVGLINGTVETSNAFTAMSQSIIDSLSALVFRQFALKPLEMALDSLFTTILNAQKASQAGGGQPGGSFWAGLIDGLFGPSKPAAKGYAPAYGLPEGIINSPHLFRFAKGGTFNLGVAGEAGPEVILPMSRNAQGQLGVNAEGMNVGTTVNVYNQADGTTTRTQERQSPLGGREVDVYIESVVDRGFTNGKFNKSMQSNFNISKRGQP